MAIQKKIISKARAVISQNQLGDVNHHQAIFYRLESVEPLRYDLRYKIAADYDLTLRFFKSQKHIGYLPNPVCIFVMGGISQTQAKLGRDEQFQSKESEWSL